MTVKESLTLHRLVDIDVSEHPLSGDQKKTFEKASSVLPYVFSSESFQKIRCKQLKEKVFSLPRLDAETTASSSPLHSTNGAFPSVQGVKISEHLEAFSGPKTPKNFGAFFRKLYKSQVPHENNPFTLLNLGLQTAPLLLLCKQDSPKNQEQSIIHHIDSTDPCLVQPQVHISLAPFSHHQFVIDYEIKKDGPYFVNALTHIQLGEGASCQIFHKIPKGYQEAVFFHSVRAELAKDAQFVMTSIAEDATNFREDVHIELKGSGSEATFNALSTLDKERENHYYVRIFHKAPHTTSNQLVKAIAHDQSRFTFDGQIVVDKVAQKTNAFQLNENILLSDKALVYSKPGLKIDADDVKASHGSTTGSISPESIFYLQSRGIDVQEAKELLLHAFAEEIREKIPRELKKYYG